MAVKRTGNFLNQQRVDVPHIRSIESAVRNDFDELINSFIMGGNASYIIRGFEIDMAGAIETPASSLQMIVENSSMLHGKSAQAGTFFQVATGTPNQTINSTTNTAVTGSFTPSSLNYIGLEFSRAVDNSTSAQVFLWNPTSKTEISKTVPLAETLNYKIVITSSLWASNVLPICIVETDSSNNTKSIQDRRAMLFRLGSGGSSTPDPFNVYSWTNHVEGREENYWSSKSPTISPFRGGDKQILHFKEWADAIMSSLLEIKGTTYWYSENSGGSIIKLRGDLALLQMTGSGKFMHAALAAGQMNWTSDVYLNYIGSRLSYKILANASGTNITLADNEVAYINIVRGIGIIPSLTFTQFSAIVNSVGAVSWTSSVTPGDYIKVGTEDDTKYYEILTVDSLSQVTLTELFLEATTTGGTNAKYAYGYYQAVAVPTTNRHIQKSLRREVPFNEDNYWLFLRADNGGTTARVYLRGSSGGELQQGEDREISDNQALDVLEYIGSPAEVDTTPDYTNAIVTGVKELRTVTLPAASLLTSGQYFTVNSSLNYTKYYVWANINGAGGDPSPAGLTPIEVALLSTDTYLQVAAKYQAVLDSYFDFDSVDHLNGTISLDNAYVGTSINSANFNMGGSFAIVTTLDGVGTFNHVVVDDDNLTKSIKRLDGAVGDIQNELDEEPYEEIIEIIAGAPANDRQVTGPVTALVNIKIPKNTRNLNVQETYVVGKADLEIHLNGQEMTVGVDYNEIGLPSANSIEVEFTQQLVVGDVLDFRKFVAVGVSGSVGPVGPAGPIGPAGADALGGPISFTTKTSSYTVVTSDSVVLANCTGGAITFTLPTAASATGQCFYFKKIDSSANAMDLIVSGAGTIDGISTQTSVTQYESFSVFCDGLTYWLF